MRVIWFVLASGTRWEDVPPELGFSGRRPTAGSTDRGHRALAGLSMGGLQTLDIGLTHLETFDSLGVFSSGWFPDRREKFEKEHQALLKARRRTRS